MRLSRIPVRVSTHSSVVSRKLARSELVSTAGGRHFPQPVIAALRTRPSANDWSERIAEGPVPCRSHEPVSGLGPRRIRRPTERELRLERCVRPR